MTIDLLNCSKLTNVNVGDELVTASQEDYYNNNPLYKEVVEIVKENGKLIFLTN